MSEVVSRESLFPVSEEKSLISAFGNVSTAIESLKKQIETINQSTSNVKDVDMSLNTVINTNKKIAESEKELLKIRQQIQNSWKEYNKELAKQEKDQIAYYKKLERESAQSAKQQARHAKMVSDSKKLLIQAMNAEKGSIEQLTAVNKRLQIQMKGLNVTIPEQAKRYAQLQNAIKANNQAMMQYAMSNPTIINGNKRVGKSFNGVQFQVTQLARELPALAYGPQMFIAAISNNFPMLQDEIKKVKDENKNLIAQGKPTVSVGKQIASSIFSWQTAIVALITVYMMFHKEINKFIGDMFNVKRSIDAVKISTKELTDVNKNAADSTIKLSENLKVIYKATQDVNEADEMRYDAIKRMRDLYPKYFEGISDEEVYLGKASKAYKELTKDIEDQEKARAILAKMEEIQIKMNELSIGGNKEDSKSLISLTDQSIKLREQIDSLNKLMETTSSDVTPIRHQKKALEMALKKIEIQKDEILNEAGVFGKIYRDLEEQLIYSDLYNPKLEKEKEKKDKKGTEPYDNRLRMLQLANEEQIIKMQMKQKDDWLRYVEEVNAKEELLASEKADLIKEYEVDQNIQLIEARRALNVGVIDLIKQKSKEKIAAAKGDKIEIANIEKQTAEEVKEILNQQLEYEKSVRDAANAEQVANADRDAAISAEKAKILSDQTVAMYWNMADEAYMASQETVLAQIKSKKLSNRQIEKLQRELAENQIEQDMLALESMIANEDLTDEEREKRMDELVQLRKRYNDLLIQNSKKGNDDDIDNIKDWARAVADIYTELFNIINSLYERQLQAAENVYKSESKYAGESVEQRIQAENKYAKKQAEIKKKQAVAQKLQSSFNLLIGSYEYIIKALAGDPIAIAQTIATGLALTAIAAEPIPAYKSGGDHKEGIARVSEEGQELFIDKKGRAFLTPKEETIAHFPSGKFIPHDETQRMLANFALTQNKEFIDMTNTNNYLKNIDKNIKNQNITNYVDGYKIIKRNGITSKIKL